MNKNKGETRTTTTNKGNTESASLSERTRSRPLCNTNKGSYWDCKNTVLGGEKKIIQES